MAGQREGVFRLEYRPLVPSQGPNKAKLTFACDELGAYVYALALTATPPTSTPTLRFDCALGQAVSETFTFTSYNAAAAASFSCALHSGAAFSVPPTVAVEPADGWEGKEVRVTVQYEPEAVGKVADTLVVSSPQLGEYRCHLAGTCASPQPKGPFVIGAAGGDVSVPLRNIFAAAKEFNVMVDSPHFSVAGPECPSRRTARTVRPREGCLRTSAST